MTLRVDYVEVGMLLNSISNNACKDVTKDNLYMYTFSGGLITLKAMGYYL